MRLTTATLAALLAISPAFAEELKSAPPPVDPNKTVTLTVGELQTLLAAQRGQVAAEAILAKVQNQLKVDAPPKK